MEAAEWFATEVGVFEGVCMGNVDVSSWYKGVELVSGIGEGAKELCEIQGKEVIWHLGSSVGFLYFPGELICNMP